MVGRVHGAGRKIDKERLVRRRRLLVADPGDALLGQVFGQVIVFVAVVGCDRCGLVVERRLPLRGLAADKAIETLEPEPGWPAVEWPGWTGFPHGCEVPLAKPRRVVAMLAQHFADGGGALRDDAVVPRVARGNLRDGAHVCAMMIASRQQGGAGRRTERCGVELVVAQSLFCQRIQGGHGHRSAKGRGGPKTDVIQEHHDYVGRALGWKRNCRPVGLGSAGRRVDFSAETLSGDR